MVNMETVYKDGNILTPIPYEHLKTEFPYMPTIIRMSKVICMWPNNGEKHPFYYHFVVWLIIIYCTLLDVSFAAQIQKEIGVMDSISTLIDFVSVFTSSTFRFIYVYVRGAKYPVLVSKMQNNFIKSSFFTTQNTTLMKYYKLFKNLFLTYGFFTFFWIAQFSTMPIIRYMWQNVRLSSDLNETRAQPIPYPIPIKIYAPFDYYKQPGNAVFYAYQSFGCFLLGYIYTVCDAFWVMVILLTMAQFDLIKESLDTISEAVRKSDEGGDCQLLSDVHLLKVSEGLKLCIKHHQFTRQFVLLIDDLYNPIILVHNTQCVLSICFILLDVTVALNDGDWHKIMFSLQFFGLTIVNTFCFNFLANELACREEQIAEAVYRLQWYRCPSERLKIQMMIAQSRKPYRLTGGRLYKLSLEFFTSMLKAIFSYFTFLFQFRNARRTK